MHHLFVPEPPNTPGLTMRPDVETESAPLEMGEKGMMLQVAA